jgi:hypothetical protein
LPESSCSSQLREFTLKLPFLWFGPGQWLLPGTLPDADVPASGQAMALNDADQIAGGATWIFDGTRAIQSDAGGTSLTTLATLGGEIDERRRIHRGQRHV